MPAASSGRNQDARVLDAAPDFVVNEPFRATSTQATTETYFDTPALNLLAAGITVLRTEDEWVIGQPGGRRRWPAAEGVPAELTDLVAPWLRANLVEIARLTVSSTTYRVEDSPANLEDCEIRASGLGTGLAVSRWRELVLTGDAPVEGLTAAGARLIEAPSRLAVAIYGHPVHTRANTAGALINNYVAAQCDALTAGHFAIVAGLEEPTRPTDAPPEAIHRTRVATRRLRASLRTFAGLYDEQDANHLERELAWFAGVLGPVRDLEVMRSRLARAVRDLPAELVIGSVGQQIDDALRRELTTATGNLLSKLGKRRYRALVADVARWRTNPPTIAAANRPASELAEYLRGTEAALAQRLQRAAADPQDELLHSARKAGKRTRYAAEAAAPALGTSALNRIKSAESLQTVLGEHQDAMVAVAMLRRVADELAKSGGNSFTYGVLAADQYRLGRAAVAGAAKLVG